MAKRAKGLTRKITRNEALSYEQTIPNKMGVTALAEINGPEAYERRYAEARRILGAGRRRTSKGRRAVYRDVELEGATMKKNARAGKYTAKQKRAMQKMSPKQRKAFQKMLSRSPAVETIRPGRKRPAKRRTMRRNRAVPAMSKAEQARYEAGYERVWGKPKKKAAKKARPKKADFVAAQLRKGRTKKQAEATWKVTHGRARKAAAAKRKPQRRTYGQGRYRALKARIGPKSRHTYMYRTKKGQVRHIPEHAVLGYPSARALHLSRQTPKGEERYRKRKASVTQTRERAAQRAAARIRAGRGTFTPNEAAEVLSFEEWKEMYKSNAKKKKKTKKRTGWTAAKRKAAAKKGAATKKRKAAARSRAAKKGAAKRRRGAAPKRKKKTTRRKKVGFAAMSAAKRRAIARKGGKAAARKKGRKPAKRKARRKTTRRAKSLTITMRANATAAQRRAAKRNIKKAQAARWGYKRNATPAQIAAARRNIKKAQAARRGYSANLASVYVEDLKNSVKIGAIVVSGYMAHRALTKVVDEYLLSKIEAMQTGTLGKWRDIIAGALVAAIGVPVVVKLVPRESAAAGAGIAASFLHGIIVKALAEAQQGEVVSYLSAYPNASSPAWRGMSGMGSYFTFRPHEIYGAAGMGEYYPYTPNQVAPVMGVGQEYFTTTGGPMTTGQLLQAAAGGVGQNQLLTQAAAGEYLAYGAQGMGQNYEQLPTADQSMYVDEGVMPNLHSAEQALNVMEAAAGVGQAEIPVQREIDVPYQSTVFPIDRALPVADEPRGSRSGVFATPGGGNQGIFGI